MELAIKMFGVATDARFDVWNLAGPHNAALRARIMSALAGVKTPQAKSGVNAIAAAFYAAALISDSTSGHKADALAMFCEGFCSVSTDPVMLQLAAKAKGRREDHENLKAALNSAIATMAVRP